MSLRLVATSASLNLGIGKDEFERPVLLFDVKLRKGEIVCLSSDGVFRNEMKGQVTFYPADGVKPDEAVGIGKLRYYDDVNFFSSGITLPEPAFHELLSAARVGRIPSAINISAEGLELHCAFVEDSAITWDNTTRKYLPVTSVSFSIPLTPIAAI